MTNSDPGIRGSDPRTNSPISATASIAYVKRSSPKTLSGCSRRPR